MTTTLYSLPIPDSPHMMTWQWQHTLPLVFFHFMATACIQVPSHSPTNTNAMWWHNNAPSPLPSPNLHNDVTTMASPPVHLQTWILCDNMTMMMQQWWPTPCIMCWGGCVDNDMDAMSPQPPPPPPLCLHTGHARLHATTTMMVQQLCCDITTTPTTLLCHHHILTDDDIDMTMTMSCYHHHDPALPTSLTLVFILQCQQQQ